MLRRLYHDQPESFEFTPDNLDWAKSIIAKYPGDRAASAVIPLLWRAQEQAGWVSRPAIEYVADMLGMAHIRVLEVATFYFMFQLQPVGSVAHFQICGTTSCMICGAEDLVAVCREKIAPNPHELSPDGKFSWEEVECLGACSNAPMAQIGKDYYEDLTAEGFSAMIDAFGRGEVPTPGPQNGRFASEPLGGRTSLTGEDIVTDANASVDLATHLGDTIARVTTPPDFSRWTSGGSTKSEAAVAPKVEPQSEPMPVAEAPASDAPNMRVRDAAASAGALARSMAEPVAAPKDVPNALPSRTQPAGLAQARAEGADDLKRIKGIGPKLEDMLNDMGYYHFDQIADWSEDEVAWVDDNLEGFKGRVTRDDWVPQARALLEEIESTPDFDGDGKKEGTEEGTKPQTLEAARDGGPDDLKKIKGVGPKLEALLHTLGFYHFDQIASWSADEVAWVDANLEGFKGRVSRDEWVKQARILAEGGDTEFSKRVDEGDVY